MRAKNYDHVLNILILKYSSGLEKLLGLSRNGPLRSQKLGRSNPFKVLVLNK